LTKTDLATDGPSIDRNKSSLAHLVHLVSKAGNMNRKRPSCLIARFPEMPVYRYQSGGDKLQVSHRVRLEESQAAAAQAELAPRRPLRDSANENRDDLTAIL
jgi:hypothetical protein